MKIRNVIHKGLRRFIEDDDGSGLPAGRRAEGPQDRVLPSGAWRHERELRYRATLESPHQMTGDRKGAWSLFVTKNWRITFQIDRERRLKSSTSNYEDYH